MIREIITDSLTSAPLSFSKNSDLCSSVNSLGNKSKSISKTKEENQVKEKDTKNLSIKLGNNLKGTIEDCVISPINIVEDNNNTENLNIQNFNSEGNKKLLLENNIKNTHNWYQSSNLVGDFLIATE